MKRKIIQLAKNTLVISLPADYCADQHLEKGHELDCTIEDHRLVITPSLAVATKKSVTVDVKDLSERTLRWYVSSLHKQGYDEITLNNYSAQQYVIVEDLINNLFVGFMIKERTSLRLIVGEVAVVAGDEFDRTLRQAFRHLNTMFEEYLQAITTQDETLLAYQLQHEKTNNKLTNFCERLLNKSLRQKEKGHFWYVIAWNLEKIADNFKYLAKSGTTSADETTHKDIEALAQFYNAYYECFYTFSPQKLSVLSDRKKELENAFMKQLSGPDAVIYHYLHMMLLQIADFSASMIALRYDDK